MSKRTLDGVHNWRSYVRRGENLAPVVDEAGGVNEYASFGGGAQTYDANGNLILDDRFRYRYDFFNRLSEVQDRLEGGRLATMEYDHRNRRILRFARSEIRRYLYRDWHVIEERDTFTASGRQYVYRNDQTDQPIQLRASVLGVDYYYHLDSRGNVGALTDEQGAVEYYPEYDAWGGSACRYHREHLLLAGSPARRRV